MFFFYYVFVFDSNYFCGIIISGNILIENSFTLRLIFFKKTKHLSNLVLFYIYSLYLDVSSEFNTLYIKGTFIMTTNISQIYFFNNIVLGKIFYSFVFNKILESFLFIELLTFNSYTDIFSVSNFFQWNGKFLFENNTLILVYIIFIN